MSYHTDMHVNCDISVNRKTFIILNQIIEYLLTPPNAVQFVNMYCFTCFGQLTIYRRHEINMIRKYYYKVRNTYVKFFI
jgi:hypothetical protein